MLSSIAQRLRMFFRSELDLAKDRLVNGPDITHHRALADLRLRELRMSLEGEIRFQGGVQHAKWLQTQTLDPIEKAAHRVHSQFGEDGVIQYLIQRVPIDNDFFIEFGVEDYRESNTRFLLEHNNWRGAIADCGEEARKFLMDSHLYGLHTIDFIQSFITAENINELFRPYAGDIGLISIDVDGVDYYLWEALDVVSPRIVVIEYQPNFGPDLLISVPYKADFVRRDYHYSNLCFGASLAAMHHLGNQKGYALVGTAGNHNAFFVRRDVLGSLPEKTPQEVYCELRVRESFNQKGERTYISALKDRQAEMADAEVIDVINGKKSKIRDLFDHLNG